MQYSALRLDNAQEYCFTYPDLPSGDSHPKHELNKTLSFIENHFRHDIMLDEQYLGLMQLITRYIQTTVSEVKSRCNIDITEVEFTDGLEYSLNLTHQTTAGLYDRYDEILREFVNVTTEYFTPILIVRNGWATFDCVFNTGVDDGLLYISVWIKDGLISFDVSVIKELHRHKVDFINAALNNNTKKKTTQITLGYSELDGYRIGLVDVNGAMKRDAHFTINGESLFFYFKDGVYSSFEYGNGLSSQVFENPIDFIDWVYAGIANA